MTGKMVESAWSNIGFFAPASRHRNPKNSKKTWTSLLDDHNKEDICDI